MESKVLLQWGNTLKVMLSFTNNNYGTVPIYTNFTSPEYVINGSVTVQVRAMLSNRADNYNRFTNLLFVKFVNKPEDNLHVIEFTSKQLGITDKTFITDHNNTWHLLMEENKQKCSFDATVNIIDTVSSKTSFAPLHEDSELTDFELRGEDGSVYMHKTILAASSPVLRRMLCGKWRESKEGHVDVPGTSMITLQHLKDFMYLHTLPETGLEQLLLLASYYMMPVLERKCVDKLVNTLTANNACDLLQFATKYNIKRLILAILQCVQCGEVKVEDMEKHLDK